MDLKKHMIINTQGAQQTSCRMGSEISALRQTIIKWWKDKERILKAARKVTCQVQGIINQIIREIS